MSAPRTLLPFQPSSMSTAQLAAVSHLARYSGRTHTLYSFQLKEWLWSDISVFKVQPREVSKAVARSTLSTGQVVKRLMRLPLAKVTSASNPDGGPTDEP